jgi:hypothetical protein
MQIIHKYGTITNGPIGDALLSPKDGYMFFDDFDKTYPTATIYTLTTAAAGVATIATNPTTDVGDTGLANAAQTGTTLGTGYIAQTNPTIALSTTRDVWFEAMCSCSYTGAIGTTSGSNFIGFTTVAAAAQTINADGTPLATTSVIGFVFAQDGCLKAQVSNATATATQVNVFGGTTLHALGTNGRTYRLAMRINRNIGVDFYVDGILRTTIAAPSGGLNVANLHRLALHCQGGASTTHQRTMRTDYVQYSFLRT